MNQIWWPKSYLRMSFLYKTFFTGRVRLIQKVIVLFLIYWPHWILHFWFACLKYELLNRIGMNENTFEKWCCLFQLHWRFNACLTLLLTFILCIKRQILWPLLFKKLKKWITIMMLFGSFDKPTNHIDTYTIDKRTGLVFMLISDLMSKFFNWFD